MRYYAVAALVLLAVTGSGYAADAGRESAFSLGSGARALGMGGGFVGLADDGSSVYWNQAALALLDEQEIDMMHVTLFAGSVYDVASIVYPHSRWGGFGVSYMRLGTSDIPVMEENFEIGRVSYSTGQLLIGYGRRLEGGFSFGTALKLVNQSLGDNSTYGIGIDLSFMAKASDHISAGLLFQDIIAPRLRLAGNLEVVPTSILAGVGVRHIRLGRNFLHNAIVGAEKPEYRSFKFHLGLESVYRGYFALRAGFDRENMTFGLGIFYQRLRFDYAYRIADGISDSHRIGLSIKFGTPVSKKIRQEAELENARGSYLILDDRRRQFQNYKLIADEFYGRNLPDSAYMYYQRALAYNEDDADVKNRISELAGLMEARVERELVRLTQEEKRRSLADGFYRQALDFYDKGSYDAALKAIEEALAEFPDDRQFITLQKRILDYRTAEVNRLMIEGDAAAKERRYTDALIIYDRILVLAPENVTVMQAIAEVKNEIAIAQGISEGTHLFTLGNLSTAKRRFEEVLSLDPGNRVANEYLGRISAVMKEVTDLEDLQKDERVWQIYLNALEYFRNGEYEKSIELWEEVLQYYPGNVNTISNIEQARLRLKPKE
ncbi:MAG: PorV/PorQ family protein [Candidatus Zixiibacteriota bacterium]|nr:MAG: PorV/PorQ family protein [candidate division Zixibacteria bacterium]